MRIVFMGTPAFAVPTLDALHAAGHEVAAVYTQPPRPAHRGKRPAISAVHQRAEELGLPVHHPASLRGEEEAAVFAAISADAAVVAAYGLLLPRAILAAPRHGCLNVHASLLPRWRGAAPIQRAILAGDRETGVAIMQMEAGLDTGPVRAEARVPLDHKTAGTLTDELARLGASLAVEVLADLDAFPPQPQPDEGVLHAPKIAKDEARIDWRLSAVQIERSVRAFNPAPGAWFMAGEERIKLLAASVLPPHDSPVGVAPGTVLHASAEGGMVVAANPGAVRIEQVQRAGRSAMPVGEMLRGYPIAIGTRLD